ncbi:Septin-1 [Podospora conica]|nr:Septin-1 [Schizothecium conicum]
MRPLPGDDALRGRSSRAADGDVTFGLPQPPPMTFFLGDESTAIPSSPQPSPTSFPRPKDVSNPRKTPASSDHAALSRHHSSLESRDSTTAENTSEPFRYGDGTMSVPATPPMRPSASPHPLISPGPSGPASAMSSVSSRRGSFTGSLLDDMGSHAPSLYGGPGNTGTSVVAEDDLPTSMEDSGSAPQLIMPSLKLPSRRPFTDEGKSMGRLKVLIAGDSGVGKTSLIKAIVQSCEHIVHVDAITPTVPGLSSSTPALRRHRSSPSTSSSGSSSRRQPSRSGDIPTGSIAEIYASTKPYPEWWSEIDDFKVLQRRKSLGDVVLDRNICFVDTPGYGSGSSSMDTITPVTSYIEGHFRRMRSDSLSDGDTLNLIGGAGGVQVDVLFYMVLNRLRPVDIRYLRQVTPLTNVMILLAQADIMSPEQVAASKEQIISQLKEAKIRLFSFSPNPSEGLYAISSATGSDHDLMDASLLMSPDYVQPLLATELITLVNQVFTQDGASWLRHAAARKYVQWRRSETTTKTLSLHHPTLTPPPNFGGSGVLTPHLGATSSYALARITDHSQREERLAHVRFANWAADLQKSLANERAQYAALARGERAVWLTEKLHECVQEGTLVAVPGGGRREERHRPRNRGRDAAAKAADRAHTDPLGLLEVAADLRRKGRLALEVLGGVGVMGAVVVFVGRCYHDWVVGEWERVVGR